jgi:pilus assembly protein CpaE
MIDPLKTCLFVSPDIHDIPFREPFEAMNELLVEGETNSWDQLREWLNHHPVDVVGVNLDEAEGIGLQVVERVSHLSPNVCIIGISRQIDPQTIIQAMRAGCSQFVGWPIDADDLRTALGKSNHQRQQVTETTKRICVIGASGGVGATTIAANLALELGHLCKRRVALVDLNLEFGDLNCVFDCEPKFTLSDVCRDGMEVDRLIIEDAMHDLDGPVALLARPKHLRDAREVSPEAVEAMLHVLGSMYPFVVVDLPRTYSFLSSAALTGVDHAFLVTQLGVNSLRNATRIYECLLEMGTPENAVNLVLNRWKAEHSRVSVEDVERHFRKPLFARIPNDYKSVQTALDLGHSVLACDPDSPARMAIKEMAIEVAKEMFPNVEVQAPRGGFLGLWRKK